VVGVVNELLSREMCECHNIRVSGKNGSEISLRCEWLSVLFQTSHFYRTELLRFLDSTFVQLPGENPLLGIEVPDNGLHHGGVEVFLISQTVEGDDRLRVIVVKYLD